MADVVRGHAQSRPDVVAIRCGPRSLTYAELDDRSNRLAQALLEAGVQAGDRVAHLDRTAPEIVELLFATSKIGAVTVPLNWRLAPAELEKIVADAGANVIIAGPAYRDVAREIAGRGSRSSSRCWTPATSTSSDSRPIARRTPATAARRATSRCRCTRPERPAFPKGVLTTQRNLAAAYLSADAVGVRLPHRSA